MFKEKEYINRKIYILIDTMIKNTREPKKLISYNAKTKIVAINCLKRNIILRKDFKSS